MTIATVDAPDVVAAPRPGAAPRLLDVRGLHKRFGALQVLDDASLHVDAGQIVALVGDNGAGKSTLAKCVARTIRPDGGQVLIRGQVLGPHHDDATRAGVGVVWQDLSLCENLDSVANLYLGREQGRVLLSEADMHRGARAALDRLGIAVPDLSRPVATLSGGQRQAIAVARALATDPPLLIMDEPTAALGRAETLQLLRLVRELRARGTAVLLITHQLDQVFELADRIVVLRQGRVVADVSPLEVHPDDVVAMQSGIEIDSTASRQLRRLGSLVEQISEADPTASLPLVVSAMAAAIGQEALCVHLLDDPARPGRPHPHHGHADGHRGPTGDGAGADRRAALRRSAAVGLPPALLAAIEALPLGPAGGPVGVAAARGSLVVSEDVRTDPHWAALAAAAAEAGIQSSWAAPIVGTDGVLGTISGYGETVGRPRGDQLELITLYAGHAATSIERERLLAESRRRNRVLEAIRSVLEVLAGPAQVRTGLDPALDALCDVLAADGAVLRVIDVTRAAVVRPPAEAWRAALDALADRSLRAGLPADRRAVHDGATATPLGDGMTLTIRFDAPGGAAALAVFWAEAERSEGAAEVLGDVARSLSLALERAELERAHQETEALRRSQRLQRAFLSRLSHELRTPLTAIHGCVDTLRQPDVEWARPEQDRFLGTIATESERMRRLVADLLDASAIDAGIFRVHPDWCDLRLVLDASVACAAGPEADRVAVAVDPALGPVWADHDRLEQVFVNLVDNALRHTPPATRVRLDAGPSPDGTAVEIRVSDDGPGVAPDVAASLFEPHAAGTGTGGHGLGLAIARGIAAAHGGTLVADGTAAPAPRPGGVAPPPGVPGAEDAPTGGATFVVSLPADPGPGAPGADV